jgi:glycosyltransferase involved in cell wall biosynthesis
MPDAGWTGTGARTLSVLQTGLHWFEAGAGGLDRVYRDLGIGLPEFGVQVRGLVDGPKDVEARTDGQISLFSRAGRASPRRLFETRQTIARLIRSGGFDLVASHFALHIATALDRLADLPLVAHFHGPWAEESRYEGQNSAVVMAKRAIERLVYRRADRVITLSHAFAEVAHQRYGVPEDRVCVVPGGVDIGRLAVPESRAEARQALGWPSDRPILFTVRRLTERMGLDRLITAIGTAVRNEPEILLLIAGRGRLEAVLRRQVEEAGLERHVRLLGFLPDGDLPLAYRAADLNVVPSTGLEGFGLTAAEALAAGTPSIVTPVGGLPEVVADLSPDLVFPSGSADDIAATLADALRGQLRLPDSGTCRTYARLRFDNTLAAARTAAIYRELVP